MKILEIDNYSNMFISDNFKKNFIQKIKINII